MSTAANPADQYRHPQSDIISVAKNFPMIWEAGENVPADNWHACRGVHMCVRGPNRKPGSPLACARLISDEVIIADWITSIVNQSLAEG